MTPAMFWCDVTKEVTAVLNALLIDIVQILCLTDWMGKPVCFINLFSYFYTFFILFYIFHVMLNHASAKCLHQILTYLISHSRQIWMFKPSTTVSFLTTSLFHKIIVFFKGILFLDLFNLHFSFNSHVLYLLSVVLKVSPHL